jgi:hypothetical protein
MQITASSTPATAPVIRWTNCTIQPGEAQADNAGTCAHSWRESNANCHLRAAPHAEKRCYGAPQKRPPAFKLVSSAPHRRCSMRNLVHNHTSPHWQRIAGRGPPENSALWVGAPVVRLPRAALQANVASTYLPLIIYYWHAAAAHTRSAHAGMYTSVISINASWQTHAGAVRPSAAMPTRTRYTGGIIEAP